MNKLTIAILLTAIFMTSISAVQAQDENSSTNMPPQFQGGVVIMPYGNIDIPSYRFDYSTNYNTRQKSLWDTITRPFVALLDMIRQDELIITAHEKTPIEWRILIADPEDDDIDIEIMNEPNGAVYENGFVMWTPPLDYVNNSLEYKDETITIRAEDENDNWVMHNITIRVLNLNTPPQITGYYPPKTFKTQIGEKIDFKIRPYDDQNDKLEYVWCVEDRCFDTTNKNTSFKFPTIFSESGTKSVKASVDDGEFTKTFRWTVKVE